MSVLNQILHIQISINIVRNSTELSIFVRQRFGLNSNGEIVFVENKLGFERLLWRHTNTI